MFLRRNILKLTYAAFPFSLRGDAGILSEHDPACDVSCVIPFFGRLDLLEGILFSLAEQEFPRTRFEVLLIEDRGGTEKGRELSERFMRLLPIRYCPLPENYGRMGYARNYGLAKAKGRYVLMLDDDTIILQKNFLRLLVDRFSADESIDAIIPLGSASYALLEGKYDYHEPYFMTNRCLAHRRSALEELGGFMSEFIGQEDVEYVMRFIIAGKKSRNSPELRYAHPPLIVASLEKPKAVGSSFYGLRGRYPSLLWLFSLVNGARHALLSAIPVGQFRHKGRFGRGFLLGILAAFFGKERANYS